MSQKGKLTNVDKLAIQQLLQQGKDLKDITKELGRTNPSTIRKYINGELDRLHQTIAEIQTEQVLDAIQDKPTKEPEESRISDETYKIAVHKLIQAGMDRANSEHLVNATINQFGDAAPDNGESLYALCLQHKSAIAKNFMVTKTGGGNEGIAVMTSAASARGDYSGERARKRAVSRSSKDAIWQPKQSKFRKDINKE